MIHVVTHDVFERFKVRPVIDVIILSSFANFKVKDTSSVEHGKSVKSWLARTSPN